MDYVKIHEPLGNSDHNQIHFDTNVKSESTNKKMYRRNFHKGNCNDLTILKYDIESIIDTFFPLKKQGKRSRKKHLSKEAIRKIVFKQTMCRVYMRIRKDEAYANYKEALNLATTEIRKYKIIYEKKIGR